VRAPRAPRRRQNRGEPTVYAVFTHANPRGSLAASPPVNPPHDFIVPRTVPPTPMPCSRLRSGAFRRPRNFPRSRKRNASHRACVVSQSKEPKAFFWHFPAIHFGRAPRSERRSCWAISDPKRPFGRSKKSAAWGIYERPSFGPCAASSPVARKCLESRVGGGNNPSSSCALREGRAEWTIAGWRYLQ
jgi:hypothetical protein